MLNPLTPSRIYLLFTAFRQGGTEGTFPVISDYTVNLALLDFLAMPSFICLQAVPVKKHVKNVH